VNRLEGLATTAYGGEEGDVTRSFSAGKSRLANVPEAMPGAGWPATATACSVPREATKMPSTVLPFETAVAKTTCPSALTDGIGWRPKPDRVPPPGA